MAGRRDWPQMTMMLERELEKVRMSIDGLTLRDRFLTREFIKSGRLIPAAWGDASGNPSRVVHRLMLGELEAVKSDPSLCRNGGGYWVKLKGLAPGFWCSKETFSRLDRYSPMRATDRATSSEKVFGRMVDVEVIKPQCDRRIWVLLLVRLVRGETSVQAVRIAPQLTTSTLVPVESGLEADFANFLVGEKRAFTKPLRYVREHEKFPDFILRDTLQEHWIEVWGMKTEIYLQYRTEKEDWAQKRGIPLSGWDPEMDKPYGSSGQITHIRPPLPPALVTAPPVMID